MIPLAPLLAALAVLFAEPETLPRPPSLVELQAPTPQPVLSNTPAQHWYFGPVEPRPRFDCPPSSLCQIRPRFD